MKFVAKCFFATIACRFIEADEELIELLKIESENKNTKRSTDYWKGIFEKWARIRGKEEQLERYDFPELNEALSQFYAELRKENGQDYEPARLIKRDAGGFRSTFKKPELPKVNPEGCGGQGKRWKERRETWANEAWENDQTKQKA